MSNWEEIKQLRAAIETMKFSESGLSVGAIGLRHFIEVNKFPFAIRRLILKQIEDIEELAENAKVVANDFEEQLSRLQNH